MSSSVVRCLFAINDADRKILNQELDAQARKIDDQETKRFMARWGFNPIKDVEVEGGPYEITPLDGRSMPAMYTSGYRRRPSRPMTAVSLVRARRQVSHSSGAQRPIKRKLRFELDNNDENQDISESVVDLDILDLPGPRKQPRNMTSDLVFPAGFISTSPPASPPASTANCSSYSPRSPNVLSSSCPAVLEADPVSGRVCPVDVPGLSRSLSASTFTQLSPDTQALEYTTPNVRARHGQLVQRQITDYVPVRKARSFKANVSPRS